MDNVSFFDFSESTTKKSIPADIYSGMMPMRNRVRRCCPTHSPLVVPSLCTKLSLRSTPCMPQCSRG